MSQNQSISKKKGKTVTFSDTNEVFEIPRNQREYVWEPFPLFDITNLYKKDCPGDGNCQFHAIANIEELKPVLVGNTPNTHLGQDKIRNLIAKYVEQRLNNKDFVLNTMAEFVPEDPNNKMSYKQKAQKIVENIRNGGFDGQGTHQTLAILAKILNYIFIVFKDHRIDVVYPIYNDNCEKCSIGLLYFSESNDMNTGHYQLLGLKFQNKKGEVYYQTTFRPKAIKDRLLVHEAIKEALTPKPKIEIIPPEQLIAEEPEIVESMRRSTPIFTSGFVDGLNEKLEDTDIELLKNINNISRNLDSQKRLQNKISVIDDMIKDIQSKQNKTTEELTNTNAKVNRLKAEKKILQDKIEQFAAKTSEISNKVKDQRSTIRHYLDESNKAVLRGSGHHQHRGGSYGPPLSLIDKATRAKLNELAVHWNINHQRFKNKADLKKALRYVVYFKTNEVDDYKSYKIIGSIYNLPFIRAKKQLKRILDQITLKVTAKSIIAILK